VFQPQFDELYRLVTRCSFSEKHVDVRCLLVFQPQFDELYRLVTRCSFSEKHVDVRCLLVFQPQFDELYRRVQTVAIEAELSQMEKCSLNEGLVLIRSFCLSLQWKLCL